MTKTLAKRHSSNHTVFKAPQTLAVGLDSGWCPMRSSAKAKAIALPERSPRRHSSLGLCLIQPIEKTADQTRDLGA